MLQEICSWAMIFFLFIFDFVFFLLPLVLRFSCGILKSESLIYQTSLELFCVCRVNIPLCSCFEYVVSCSCIKVLESAVYSVAVTCIMEINDVWTWTYLLVYILIIIWQHFLLASDRLLEEKNPKIIQLLS